ncbi:exodeoxyribonuclease V subunit gamma [Nocardia asteroides]|uniref:exodeoxyribonuclease V subunit gamma n=1 Tax=Nocardia asteroides TaxID=1824 RepID=UPI001E2B4503|nr:exodeoxyribonuclease V subunit gamma [Nocardia asteroides]UGT63128.1 exodeoxyribonuclease V subunit gamma [Nocardia asteroides]
MPLHIHRAERADTLADALARQLATPPADPFTAEVVAVPAKGIERWLTQRLSGVLGTSGPGAADGIAAAIRFPSPAALVAECLAAASGVAAADDPWERDRVVWALLRVLDGVLGAPWAAVLTRHLGAEHRAGRRYATAVGLAALFESYAAQRPELILAWAAGADTDGAGRPLPADLGWQPALWRELRAATGVPGPAERLAEVCARLRADPASTALPHRLSLFGPTRLPADQRAVLAALAAHRELHLWLTHPSPALWDRIATRPPALLRSADTSVRAVRNPLLAGLGRDVRELQQRLAGCDAEIIDEYHPPAPPGTGRSGPGAPSAGAPHTLLAAVQAAVREDTWPPAPDPSLADDGTVRIHLCHGRDRQVEVLRDALFGLFAADPTLEPRDVLVMCPDVETFAPLVRAAFGSRGSADAADEHAHPGHRLRVRLADRGRAVTNPLLTVVATLLELADGRVTVTQVLDLAAAETVRRRCGFDDDELERLRGWAADSGARWGIGLRQRQAFGLADFAQNTLNSAVDRILLGVTAAETDGDWLDLALPLDDVDSNDVDLAGRFAEFVDRLAVCLRDLRGPRPAPEWSAVLIRALDLLCDVPEQLAWQRTEARTELAAATEHAGEVVLRLADVATVLAGRLGTAPTRANFRTGELTVCTLVPMRSVPHRVVVLLGLDDEVFPRAGGVDGDDVLARDPQVGEREPRGEDRQLLLDAVLAAQERLLVCYTGADPVTGAHRPPAVPVAELLDALRAHTGAGADRVVVRHPLQSFDRRNFAPEHPFGFDPVALAGAEAAARPPRPRPAFLADPLPPPEPGDVELAELIAFVEHPVRAFLGQRLGLRVPDHEEEIDDRLPVELDGLAKWDLGERLLAARLTGADPETLRAAEWRRGGLPPFAFGAAVLDEVERTVETLVRTAQPHYEIPARAVDIALDLGNGRRLTGTVPEVHGDRLVRTTFSRVAAKHRIAAWVPLLALSCTEDRSWQALTIGRGRFRTPAWRSELTAPEPPAALGVLRTLVAMRDAGLSEPLPIAPTATAAYAQSRMLGNRREDAEYAALQEFDGDYGDNRDRHLRYVWGERVTLASLLAAPAPQGGGAGEPTRFGALARRLWEPLLRAEQQGRP